MNQCVYCGEEMDEDRPFPYCMKEECYDLGFKQTEYVILGVHKSTPIICSPTDSLVTANKTSITNK